MTDHALSTDARDQIAAVRAHSLRVVQTVFAGIVLFCTACGLAVHLSGAMLDIPQQVRQPVATAFLIMALADLAILLGCRAWLSRD
jgi:hypothetical protein